jgi:imidazolonepropionase
LTIADELKGLDVIAAANLAHPVDLVATCLGAHSVPPEHAADPARWERLVCEELWPAAASRARYADVFTESHVFGLDASRRLMQAAKDVGLGVRMHVDQLTPLGGAELAAELGAASADHLEHVTPRGIEALARAGVVPVLCPLVPLYLRESQEAPARRMVQGGLAPALSTDFNPGSCYCMSLFEVMSFAALRYGFSAAEALTGATLNAAASLGLGADRGSLEVGKRADLVVTDLPNHSHLTYEVGRSPVAAVVKDGRVVWRRGPTFTEMHT